MKVSCVAALASLGAASAFVQPTAFTGVSVQSGVKTTSRATTSMMADMSKLPGATAPLGIWDPAGLGERADEETLAKFELAELKHGRLAMMAAVGLVWGESFHPLFQFKDGLTGTGLYHPQALLAEHPWFWPIGFLMVIGWFEVGQTEAAKDPDHIPGDFGFDPLNIVSEGRDSEEFITWRQRELNNGRLAMMACAGQWAQERVSDQGILEHFQS